jgi:hypothetical protein
VFVEPGDTGFDTTDRNLVKVIEAWPTLRDPREFAQWAREVLVQEEWGARNSE